MVKRPFGNKDFQFGDVGTKTGLPAFKPTATSLAFMQSSGGV